MLHIIYGNGKGKTTSAAGLALRAAGHGLSVYFIQFLKDGSSGEIAMLRRVPGVTVCHSPVHYGFTRRMSAEEKEETRKACRGLLQKAKEAEPFLLILDEALCALKAGMIQLEELEEILEKPCEIVLTGREAPEALKARADYLTKIEAERHPLEKGIRAREGIEF